MGGGGAERQLAYLSQQLVRRGWGVHIALLSEGPNFSRLQQSGAAIHRLQARGNHDPAILWRLARIIGRVKPDLVQVWMLQMEILGAFAAALRGVPWILSERCCEEAYPPRIKSQLRQWTGARATAIISNSRGGDQYWQRWAPPSVARYVIPNALPLDEIAAAPPVTDTQAGLSPSDRVVLFAARLADQKNPQTLVRALARLKERPDVVAVIAGEGPLMRVVVEQAKQQDVALRCPGYLQNVWGWMKRAAVFVSPALFEGHPNTVMEAAACGCPLIVSDIPAHREFLDESSALLVPALDPARMAAAIAHVLDDPGAAQSRAQRARATANSWSAERIAAEYETVYFEVLDHVGRRTKR
jgi:glycosyltransferase involved in cell wall biosynthesis